MQDRKEYLKEYRKKNIDSLDNYLKKYKEVNKDALKEKNRIYREKHKSRHSAWKEVNKEKIKRQRAEYHLTRKEFANNYCKEWFSKNKDKKKAYIEVNKLKFQKIFNDRRRDRTKTDENFRLINNARSRIREVLKGIRKNSNTMNLVGCSVESLKQHLEAQFKPGMNWENYNFKGWHVDHIIPCSWFDFTNPEQQKKCFHYTNLQPLWAKENLSKGARIHG